MGICIPTRQILGCCRCSRRESKARAQLSWLSSLFGEMINATHTAPSVTLDNCRIGGHQGGLGVSFFRMLRT